MAQAHRPSPPQGTLADNQETSGRTRMPGPDTTPEQGQQTPGDSTLQLPEVEAAAASQDMTVDLPGLVADQGTIDLPPSPPRDITLPLPAAAHDPETPQDRTLDLPAPP